MKSKTREIITVNIVLFTMLTLLAVTALGNNGVLSAIANSKNAVYKVETEHKAAALMCNVYWGTEYIEPLLALFARLDVRVTFFIGGTWAQDNPELVKQMLSRGHEIANHGWQHRLCSDLDRDGMRREIALTDKLLEQITGIKPTLFAPPSGDYNNTLLDVAAGLGYKTIMWSVDTIDWRDRDAGKIASRITNNIKPGAFVLSHPTAETVTALTQVLPQLQAQGYTFVSVTQLLKMGTAA